MRPVQEEDVRQAAPEEAVAVELFLKALAGQLGSSLPPPVRMLTELGRLWFPHQRLADLIV